MNIPEIVLLSDGKLPEPPDPGAEIDWPIVIGLLIIIVVGLVVTH